jgi:hypothetical protein
MARSHHRRRTWFIASLIVPLALAFAGCATNDRTDARADASTPSVAVSAPTPSITMPPPTPLAGHTSADDRSVDVAMPIPAGAHSVVVDFQCTGGAWFNVEFGDRMTRGDAMMLDDAPYRGRCGGTKELAWPIVAGTDGTLQVYIPANADWTALPHFSTDEFKHDAAVTMDCKKFSWVSGELSDADNGYLQKAFGADQWRTRVEQAAADLAAQATSSQSSLKGALTQLVPLLKDPALKPGMTLSVAQSTMTQVSEACTANQTEFVIQAHFGG